MYNELRHSIASFDVTQENFEILEILTGNAFFEAFCKAELPISDFVDLAAYKRTNQQTNKNLKIQHV